MFDSVLNTHWPVLLLTLLMEMRKCRLGVVIYFSRGVLTLVHRKYTENNALLKLCDIGKSGKQFFFFILALCLFSDMERCSLRWVFLKSKQNLWRIPLKGKKEFIFNNVAGLQNCMLWSCKFSLNIFEQLPVCFCLWLCYIWFLRCHNK